MYNVMNEVDSKQLFHHKQINTKILLSDSWSMKRINLYTDQREETNTNYKIKSLSLTPEVRINLLVHRPERGWQILQILRILWM